MRGSLNQSIYTYIYIFIYPTLSIVGLLQLSSTSGNSGVILAPIKTTFMYSMLFFICILTGQRRGDALNWCQVAYWEMAQRIGERYPAETSIVNVYSEVGNGSLTTTAMLQNNGMCLQKLFNQRRCTTTSSSTSYSNTGSNYLSHDIQYTRQKIGLGKFTNVNFLSYLYIYITYTMKILCLQSVTNALIPFNVVIYRCNSQPRN